MKIYQNLSNITKAMQILGKIQAEKPMSKEFNPKHLEKEQQIKPEKSARNKQSLIKKINETEK